MENTTSKKGKAQLSWSLRVTIRLWFTWAVFVDMCLHDRRSTANTLLVLWMFCSLSYAWLAGVGIRPWHFETLPLFAPVGLWCAQRVYSGASVLLRGDPADFRFVAWHIWGASRIGLALSYVACWMLLLFAGAVLCAGIVCYL